MRVIRHAVALYDERLDGVDIETHLSEDLPAAMLDTEQIRRVFVNLIDNAKNALTARGWRQEYQHHQQF